MRAVTLILLFISSVCVGQNQLAFDRNPTGKGQMFIATTFSVNHNEGENQTGLLQNFDETYRVRWDITLRSGYFIKDNFALGGFFKYSSDLNQSSYQNDTGPVRDERLERGYSLAPFMRNYLPLGNSVFALFNETNLEFTYGSSVRQVQSTEDINRTTGESYQLKLGIQPGIAAFITDVVSFEVGTSLLGLSTKYQTGITNGDEDTKSYTFSNEVSFDIDLLSLFLGISFYFPVK